MTDDIKLEIEEDLPEYSLSIEDGELVVAGEVEFDGQTGVVEIRFNDEGLSNQLRDLAEQLDHPEITKCRVDTCLGCGGVVDQHSYKDEDVLQLANICRECGLTRTKSGVMVKV
jgi:hypothetical protein